MAHCLISLLPRATALFSSLFSLFPLPWVLLMVGPICWLKSRPCNMFKWNMEQVLAQGWPANWSPCCPPCSPRIHFPQYILWSLLCLWVIPFPYFAGYSLGSFLWLIMWFMLWLVPVSPASHFTTICLSLYTTLSSPHYPQFPEDIFFIFLNESCPHSP